MGAEDAPGVPSKAGLNDPPRWRAKRVAAGLYGLALFVAFVLGYVGLFLWPKPIIVATGVAIGLGATFLFLVAVIVSEDRGELLRRFLRDDAGAPSLARLQFVSWTALVIFVFGWITLIRVFSGVAAFSGSFPANLLGILIISTGATVTAQQIEAGAPLPQAVLEKLKTWSSLLNEVTNDKKDVHPSLARFQMLGWTVVSIGIYVGIVFVEVHGAWVSGSAGSLASHHLDPTLLVLMGMSQSGYLAAKYVTYNAPTNGGKKDPPEGAPPVPAAGAPPVTQ